VPSERQLYDCLINLPDSLEQAYSLLCARKLMRLQKHQRKLVQWVLAIVTVCARPLSYKELQSAYAMSNGELFEIPENPSSSITLRLAPDELVGLCGGLIVLISDRFSIVHNSAKEFLTCTLSRPSSPQNHLEVFKVDLVKSHQLMRDICLNIIEPTDKEGNPRPIDPVDLATQQNPLVEYAIHYGMHHVHQHNLFCIVAVLRQDRLACVDM
jgi:hypothetical protein